MIKNSSSSRRVYSSDLAGSWYSSDAAALRHELQTLIRKTGIVEKEGSPPRALIVPHAGYMYSGRTAAHAFARVAECPYRRVIVLGPTHRVPLRNAVSVPEATHYETILGEIPIDTDLISRLCQDPYFRIVRGAQPGEHSVEIMFPFLQVALRDFLLVPLVAGQLDERAVRAVAHRLREELEDQTLLVISTDFTHYGGRFDYVPFTENVEENLRQLDFGAFDFIRRRDLAGFHRFLVETGATICGRDTLSILLALMEDGQQEVRLLRYETSGTSTGDWTNVVSYIAAEVAGPWPTANKGESARMKTTELHIDAEDRRRLLQLARRIIEEYVLHHRAPDAANVGVPITEGMRQIAGGFVTLHKHGELRGCIGEIEPERELYRVVRDHALNAAFKDPRFPAVTADELSDITIEISVLTPPKRVSSWHDIEVGRHGVVLHKAGRSAVFLPQVAPEQGWDVETMLSHLARKAGLPAEAWREGAHFDVFEAIVFGE